MSSGVNFCELALDLRRQLTEVQDELAASKAQADKPSHASQMAKRWGSIMPKAQGVVMPDRESNEDGRSHPNSWTDHAIGWNACLRAVARLNQQRSS